MNEQPVGSVRKFEVKIFAGVLHLFFLTILERVADVLTHTHTHWIVPDLMNNISEFLNWEATSLTGSTLTSLEAPFSLVFKGSSMAETLLRLFDCSMNQQETLTVYTRPFLHKRIHTRKEGFTHQQRLRIVFLNSHS